MTSVSGGRISRVLTSLACLDWVQIAPAGVGPAI